MENELDDSSVKDLQDLLEDAIAQILRTESSERFLAWMRNQAVYEYPGVFDQIIDDRGRLLFAALFGRSIWNATPLPGNQFRPRPLPRLSPDAPCPCGSRLAYKNCCIQFPAPDFPMHPEDMLFLVLQQMPVTMLATLPLATLPRPAVGMVAARWAEIGRPERAVKLLEPLFRDAQQLDDDNELAFDTLVDCYNELDRPRKKQDIIARVAQGNSRAMRAVALHRLCTIQADAQDMEGAWSTFQQALRECPEHQSHGHLEITLLMAEGKVEQAAERARFWLARLRRQGLSPDHPAVQFYKDVVADPQSAMVGIAMVQQPEVELLQKLIEEMRKRPVSTRYRLETRDGVSSLVGPGLRRLEQDWQKMWPLPKPFSIDMEVESEIDVWEATTCQAWLVFLAEHPQAFDSLSILDDLSQATLLLDEVYSFWADAELMQPMLERAEGIFVQCVPAAQRVNLAWALEVNRPLLRLLAHLIYLRQRRGDEAGAKALMERLLSVNPSDNHGFRHSLATLLLRGGEDAALLALAEPYAGDMFPELTYGKVLALYRLGRMEEAREALRVARSVLPRVYSYLVAKRPRKPRLDPESITLGGDDQAWNYRLSSLDLWKNVKGALAWLKECA